MSRTYIKSVATDATEETEMLTLLAIVLAVLLTSGMFGMVLPPP